MGGWADGLITVNQPVETLERVVGAFREEGGDKPAYLQVHLAALIGGGGTLASFASNWVDTYLIARSVAAPAFQTSQVAFEIWPLLVGLLVGVIALTWDRGVVLEKDTEGLI